LEHEVAIDGDVIAISRQEELARADEAGLVGPVHERPPDGEERKRAHHEVHEVLHHEVGRVLGATETRFDHREAGLHEVDQEGSDEHPDEVDWRARVCFERCRSGRVRRERERRDRKHEERGETERER